MEEDEEALPPSEYIAPREKSFCPRLESVDELDRLAVGVRHHDARAGLDVGEHGLRRRRFEETLVRVIAELSRQLSRSTS